MRHLSDLEFYTGGPHPLEHIGCGLKNGGKDKISFDWGILQSPQTKWWKVILITSTINAYCRSGSKFGA